MKARANGSVIYKGLIVEHEDDYQVFVTRQSRPQPSGSLACISDMGCFSDGDETPLTKTELKAVEEIERAYTAADLY